LEDYLFKVNIIQLVTNLLVAITVAIITAKLSLNHFYKREIWLRKEAKYSEIVDKLSAILNYKSKEYDIYVFNEEIDIDKNLEIEYKESLLALEKLRYSTGFIIDSEVNKIIDEMIKDFRIKGENEIQGDLFGHLDRVYSVINDSIPKIIEIANKDLNRKT